MVAAKSVAFDMVGGPGLFEADPNSKETSVTPAWRSAKTTLYMTIMNLEANQLDEWNHAIRNVSTLADQVRAISPKSGAYINESDLIEPNWEENFWGMENYTKLKSIKQKYDPTGMFRVWNGIGGLRPESSRASSTQDFTFLQ